MKILVRCPSCKQSMQCEPRKNLVKKRKTCVYCGKNFAINQDSFVRNIEL